MDSSAETLLHLVEFGLLVAKSGADNVTGFMGRLPFSGYNQKTTKGLYGGRKERRISFFAAEMVIC